MLLNVPKNKVKGFTFSRQMDYSGSRSGNMKNVSQTALKSPFHPSLGKKTKKQVFSSSLVRDSKFTEYCLFACHPSV